MKLKNCYKDKGLLLLVLGILIFLVSYYFGFRKLRSETQDLMAQNEILNEQLAELEIIAADKDWYDSQRKELQNGIEEKICQFPSDIISEEIILYMEELEQAADAYISSVTLPERKSISVEPEKNPSVLLETAGLAEENNNDAGSEIQDIEQMSIFCIESNIAYSAAYSGFKDMIRLITTDAERKSIDNISVVFDENTGKLSGTMTVNYFILEGTGKEYLQPEASASSKGVECIFGNVEKKEP